LLNLEKELIARPGSGTSLGHDVYKIRLQISSVHPLHTTGWSESNSYNPCNPWKKAY